MKICVLIKQVASEDSPIIISESKESVDTSGFNLITNEPDAKQPSVWTEPDAAAPAVAAKWTDSLEGVFRQFLGISTAAV